MADETQIDQQTKPAPKLVLYQPGEPCSVETMLDKLYALCVKHGYMMAPSRDGKIGLAQIIDYAKGKALMVAEIARISPEGVDYRKVEWPATRQ